MNQPHEQPNLAEIIPTVTRRQLIQYAGLAALAAATRQDKRLQDDYWPDTETSLQLLEEDGRLPAAEGWLVVPGLGNQNGETMARQFKSQLPWERKSPVAYFNYANQGYTRGEIASKALIYASRLKAMSIYGHSMGGVTALDAIRGLETPISRIVLNCAPFDIDDARDGFAGKVLGRVADALHLDGGPLTTYTGTVVTDTRRDGFRFDNFLKAAEQTLHGSPPKLQVSQMKHLASFNLNQGLSDFKGCITPSTQVLYIAPAHLLDDKTVDNLPAFHKWSTYFENFGTNVETLSVPNMGHADTRMAAIEAKYWLNISRDVLYT